MKKLIFFALTLFVIASCSNQKSDMKIDYEKYTLDNGLDVILHVDKSDPIVAFAVQFHVGSNREVEGRTGFAHLFEHMMFQQSENVPEDQFFKLIQNAGGTLNGGTGNDATTYYEVVPKNAMEMILWMESDRMGYLANTVTEHAFNIQQNVVQNEKRQRVDNNPYGHTGWVKATNLYPKGHPYSWTVIGEMEDLLNATIDDVKEFHAKWYVPNNATIILAGDFEIEVAKQMINNYFGEIPRGETITDPVPQPVTLTETKKLYHEDNFAQAAQLKMIWPSVEQYHPDSYALNYLSQLLSSGKKSPFYKILEKDRKLTSSYYCYNGSQEIAGEFTISVTANRGVSLSEVETAIMDGFKMFEEEGFSEDDVERIKASLETGFYNGMSSILGKAFQLAQYNETTGTPSYIETDLASLKAVTKEDILRVYNKYIKAKPFFATSFVPKGQLDLVAEGSIKSNVVEEDITKATEVEIAPDMEGEVKKTKTSFDRSVQPPLGLDPLLNIPEVWEGTLTNEMRVLGIEHHELPLVQYSIVLEGGHYLDNPVKSGTAFLLSELMLEGTQNKTPLELQEEIEGLGSYISIRASNNSFSINVNTLKRNYEKTIALVEEVMFEPRWDEEEFEMAKAKLISQLARAKANPGTLASNAMNELIYGKGHIFSLSSRGSEETVANITIEDLKAYYEANFSPSVATFHVAGDIDKVRVMNSLSSLSDKWKAKDVSFPEYALNDGPEKSAIYFVDVPGAKQSVINIGNLSINRSAADFYPATVMAYKLGGSFNSDVNLVLREEKGFTYGARASFSADQFAGRFLASSSVRSSATAESVSIFKDLMEKYRDGIDEDGLNFTKNALIKSNALRFETLGALLRMLQNISMYNLEFDYVKSNENVVNNMTYESHKALANKYIRPEKMYYVVAGDAATQMKGLKEVGFGKPIPYKK